MTKKSNQIFGLVLVGIMLIIMESCSQKEEKTGGIMTNSGNIDLSKLAEKSIYFGHMSVGKNIIGGMKRIMKQRNHADTLKIKEITASADIDGSGFYHSAIRENLYPFKKIQNFEKKLIDEKFGEKLEIAFFKFCYVDIREETDIDQVFDTYVESMDRISARYPDLKLIHFTCPLKSHLRLSNIKSKNLNYTLRKFARLCVNQFTGDQDNIRRNEYNKMLREKFGSSGLIFDLAELESQKDDGTSAVFRYKKSTYNSLNDDLTFDGGHLNEAGSNKIAEALLVYLNEMVL